MLRKVLPISQSLQWGANTRAKSWHEIAQLSYGTVRHQSLSQSAADKLELIFPSEEADHLSLVVESDLLPHWAHDTFLPRDPYPICTLHIRVPRISRREYEYDIENLKVQCSPFWIFCPKWKPARDLVHTWIDFGEYLERCVQDIYFPMTSAFRRTVGATGCSNLFNWYQTSGRPFRFQDVPLELRQQIYEYAMGADIYPQVKDIIGVPSVCMGKGFIPQAPFSQLDGTHSPKEEVQPPNLTLSYLNKEIHIEFMGTLWRSARMSFSEPICLQNVATLRLTLPTFALRRIGLNFRNLEYIQFFGVDVIANRQDDITYLLIPSGVAAARILNNGQIPNLGELDIKFRSTRWSPWLGLGAYGLINERDSLCQRDITETILALALDFIFQIDKVNLEGDVKDITKAEFSRAIKKKKKDPTYEPAWPVKKNDIFDSSRTDAFTW